MARDEIGRDDLDRVGVLAPLLLGGLGGVSQHGLAFGDRIDAGGELALDLHGDAAGLIGVRLSP
jgi:hypothetical protein